MVDFSCSLDKSIEPQLPLKPGSDSELSSSLTLLPAEQQQDSSSDPQLPPTSPGTAHPSHEPCSVSTVVDDPPSPAIADDQVMDPAPGLTTPADLIPSAHPPPALPSAPSIPHPPSPSDTPAVSTIAPPAHQDTEPCATAVTPSPAEVQSRLSSSPQPHPPNTIISTTTAPSPTPATIATTTTTTTTTTATATFTNTNTVDTSTIVAATGLSSFPPSAVLLQKDLLPTPPVSDCSPPQLYNSNCQLDSHPPPPLPLAVLPALDQPILPPDQSTLTSSIHEVAPSQPLITSSPSHSSPVDQSDHCSPSATSHKSPPPQPLPITTSVNSLSPLSDVPSVHSPGHVIESPITHSQSHHSPNHSPVSVKRQASPFMQENGTTSIQTTDASPAHVNGNSVHTNGQSAHKRPRLTHESSPNPPVNSTISNPPSNPSTTPSHQATARLPPQSMVEPVGFVPGHPGTQLTKDQHRFAISVTKQLKKHRSSHPFVQPVDPVALNIPDYFNVITHPMDLGTIEARLGKVGKPCYYRSVQEFVSDVQLVFSNCYTYNGPPHASLYSRMAADLSIQFETQMKKMPPDDTVSYGAASHTHNITKSLPKAKSSAESRTSPPASKRKNPTSMAGNFSSLPAGQTATGQKRRSISPQHPRKKTSKATSLSVPTLSDGHTANSEIAWRASIHDPSSSQRAKTDSRDQFYSTGNHYGMIQSVTEPHIISNAKAELKFCKDVLREVNKKVYEKFVWPFYEPVDIVKLGIPDYPKYVKRPMDLETMKNKLAHGEYPNGAAFAEDFRLMLKNCYAFNPPTSAYYHCGKQLESLFEAKWAERPPPEIPAPVPAPTAAAGESSALDPIQVLQMQVAQLQERINMEASKKGRSNSTNVIPGTGPPKKQPYARGSAQSKSLTNPSISGPLSSGVAAAPVPKGGKTASSGPAKPKQAHGGARRKSAGSTLAPAVKRQSQSFEQPVLDRPPENPEQPPQSYQTAPLVTPAAASEPLVAPPPATSRRLSEPDYFEKIDYEQKKDLATQIQNAVEPMQSNAINLIRTSRPDLVPADGEEIELDIDALDDRTLYQLYQLVCAPAPPPPIKGKKGVKGVATNGKPKGGGRRKAGPGATKKPSTTVPAPYPSNAAQVPGFSQTEVASGWPQPTPEVANGHGNGTKPKANKKPRASAPGPRRKGIDETQEAARIKELEEKLHEFQGYTDAQPYQNNHSNGVSSTNLALGPALNEPPPAGPVEYASSSSESESESDDDSD